jgi:hypothetical protein
MIFLIFKAQNVKTMFFSVGQTVTAYFMPKWYYPFCHRGKLFGNISRQEKRTFNIMFFIQLKKWWQTLFQYLSAGLIAKAIQPYGSRFDIIC